LFVVDFLFSTTYMIFLIWDVKYGLLLVYIVSYI
jgi:hypothetical protein